MSKWNKPKMIEMTLQDTEKLVLYYIFVFSELMDNMKDIEGLKDSDFRPSIIFLREENWLLDMPEKVLTDANFIAEKASNVVYQDRLLPDFTCPVILWIMLNIQRHRYKKFLDNGELDRVAISKNLIIINQIFLSRTKGILVRDYGRAKYGRDIKEGSKLWNKCVAEVDKRFSDALRKSKENDEIE